MTPEQRKDLPKLGGGVFVVLMVPVLVLIWCVKIGYKVYKMMFVGAYRLVKMLVNRNKEEK